MTRTQYKDLMQDLDAAVNNGYGKEVLAMTPEELLDDLIDESGPVYLRSVPRKEAIIAIGGWQQRTREWFK